MASSQPSRQLQVVYRDLSTLEEFAAVAALEQRLWGPGYEQPLPYGILVSTAECGGILLGAYCDDELVGFVYSIPAIKGGRLCYWSYKLGVLESARNLGIGHQLKLLQRERALQQGADFIEWTFDPLQATNAHLNLVKLGASVEEYRENFYHSWILPVRQRGCPTDRFIVRWRLRRDLEPASGLSDGADLENLVPINRFAENGGQARCTDIRLDFAAPRLRFDIPTRFSDLMTAAPELALQWRLASRSVFNACFRRDYRVRNFVVDWPNNRGVYILAK